MAATHHDPADDTPAPAENPDQGDLFGGPPRPAGRRTPSPSFAKRAPDNAPRRGRAWLLVLLLAATLLSQVALLERDRLAADARWRPWVDRACETLGCALPPWRETSAFHVTAREVRPHPSVAGALLITATFRNGAAYAQAWPLLELSLQDLDGHEVAMRRFAPAEYLGAAPASTVIRAGQSANVTLEVVDPGRSAIAFSFEFR